MSTIKVAVVIAVIIIVAAVVFVVIKKREKKVRDDLYNKTKKRLDTINANLSSSAEALERTEIISKSDDAINHYNTWKNEYADIETQVKDLQTDFADVDKTYQKGTQKDFIAANETINFRFDAMDEKLGFLHTRLYNYTSYELENTEIALDLKDQLKELQADFEKTLSLREIYTETFYHECNIIENELRHFEDLQRSGDYTKARKYLKNATDLINNVSYNYDVITNMIDYIEKLDKNIQIIDEVSMRITEKKFRLDQDEHLRNYEKLKTTKQAIEQVISELRVNIEISSEFIRTNELQLEEIQQGILNIKHSIEEQYSQIKIIDTNMEKNKEYLAQCEVLVAGAIEERDEINRLYEMPSSRHIQKLESEISQFEKFKTEYSILLDIVYDLKEDYTKLVERIEQSNEYLIHFMNNIKQSLVDLKEIRIDEIEALESIDSYKNQITKIEFYITAQDHYYQMSRKLAENLNDTINKIAALEQHLLSSPLKISEVRKLKIASETLIADLKVLSEQEIKDKELATLIIRFISRFVDSDDTRNVMMHCRTLYLNHDYSRVASEGEIFIKTRFENGEILLEQINQQAIYQTFADYCEQM